MPSRITLKVPPLRVPVCRIPRDQTCHQRHPHTLRACMRRKGHGGRHLNYWANIDEPFRGKVREVWS